MVHVIIAEFTMDHTVCQEPLNRVSGIKIEWEQTYEQLDGPTQMIAWIESDDFEAVNAAIKDDPRVENPRILTDFGGRRLYRVDFTDFGRETNLLPEVTEVGGVLQQAVGTNDGWECRIRFPDREAFEHIYRFCRDNEIPFRFNRIYEQTDRIGGEGSMLTDAQRETLTEAVDSGFLDIPRKCTLAELGERLGVSETATSERFRRAVKNLIKQTVNQ